MNEQIGFCNRVGCHSISHDYSEEHGFICSSCKKELDTVVSEVLRMYPDTCVNVIIATYMKTSKVINQVVYDDGPMVKLFRDD